MKDTRQRYIERAFRDTHNRLTLVHQVCRPIRPLRGGRREPFVDDA